VEPATFTTLKKGGAANDYHVESIVYCGGKPFGGADGEALPYKVITFRQK
jgi:hypothetical protein